MNDTYRTVVIDEQSLSYVFSVCLSVILSAFQSVSLSVILSAFQSVSLSVCQSGCLSAFLSVSLPQHKFVFINTASNRCVNLLQ